MLKITTNLNSFIYLITIILIMGIIFASRIFIMLGLLPLLFVLICLLVNHPREVTAKRRVPGGILLTGDILAIDLDVNINRGIGMVALVDILPGEFELVEGSNYKLIWKGLRPQKETIHYRVRTTTAGLYYLNIIAYETYHCANMKAPIEGTITAEQKLEIRPRILEIKKIRDVSTKSKIPLPLGAIAKMGIPTLEFRELRQYQRGDPFKYINWKATARSTGGTFESPLVNEYEKEGKKTVWLFLDHSPDMNFGANIKNAFECALEAVNGLADYYLKHDCRVALCSFNGGGLFVYPAAGKRQYYKLLREMMQFKTIEKANTEESKNETEGQVYKSPTSNSKGKALRDTVVKYKGYLYGSNPLCIVVTRLTRESAEALSSGIKEMMKYTPVRKERYSVMVINISGYDLGAVTSAEKMAAEILKKRNHYYSIPLKKGISWVDWNPARYSFTTALLRQVLQR